MIIRVAAIPRRVFLLLLQSFTSTYFTAQAASFSRLAVSDDNIGDLSSGKASPTPINNLTMCAMVRNEIPFAIEWIEHYRLQGVDRFMLYDDGSTDDTALLGHFYATNGFPGLITVLPANSYRNNREFDRADYQHHQQTQNYVLDHCNKRSVGRTRWIIVVDVDEFFYAPNGGTVWSFIESKQRENEVRVHVRILIAT